MDREHRKVRKKAKKGINWFLLRLVSFIPGIPAFLRSIKGILLLKQISVPAAEWKGWI